MSMPGTQLGLESHCERCFLDTFVQLKKVRMCLSDSNPDNLHVTFRREGSDAFDRQKKRAKFNRTQFFTQRRVDIVGNVRKKAEREVDLIRRSPAHPGNVRIEMCEEFADRVR